MVEEYLTEKMLGGFLSEHIAESENDIQPQAAIPGCDPRQKVDYLIKSKKLIVEFDGYRHFSCPKTNYTDFSRDQDHEKLGYQTIRIPYFLQLDKMFAEWLFSGFFNEKPFGGFNDFPHGFIDNKAMLPAAFCEVGTRKFLGILDELPIEIRDAVLSSLWSISKKENSWFWVLPTSMWPLIDIEDAPHVMPPLFFDEYMPFMKK